MPRKIMEDVLPHGMLEEDRRLDRENEKK